MRHPYERRVTAHLTALVSELDESVRPLVSRLVDQPGKRLRSTLLAACVPDSTVDPAPLGALVELVHVASLLHDDIIDKAAVRRGLPAAHVVANEELATLAGLACFALAGKQAADLGSGVSLAVSTAVAELSVGELLDVQRAFDTELSIADYLELVTRKTGELFRLPCVLGAMISGADRTTAEVLAGFGLELGVAFQILDDCLDLRVDLDQDKPTGTDHQLGLFGAPTLYALYADPDGNLMETLLSPSFGIHDMPVVRSMVVARGGLARAGELARQRHQNALAILERLPDEKLRTSLRSVGMSMWRDVA
jgi:geranylgeranyl pyrophosphate synthase